MLIQALRNEILGCIAHRANPSFVQQNPRMVRIRTLRITYVYMTLYMYMLAHLFTDVSECSSEDPVGTGLASKWLPHDHESVTNYHHLINLQHLVL